MMTAAALAVDVSTSHYYYYSKQPSIGLFLSPPVRPHTKEELGIRITFPPPPSLVDYSNLPNKRTGTLAEFREKTLIDVSRLFLGSGNYFD